MAGEYESPAPANSPSEGGAASGKPAQSTPIAGRPGGDPWSVWLLALAAIMVPVVVLLCVGSIPVDRVAVGDLSTAARRGDFLVPVLILCAETIRRWCRDVHCGRILRFVRIFAVTTCGLAGSICFSATVIAAKVDITPAVGASLITITWWCLVVALVFGTWAVAASCREARS
jgi:hypothetical protein